MILLSNFQDKGLDSREDNSLEDDELLKSPEATTPEIPETPRKKAKSCSKSTDSPYSLQRKAILNRAFEVLQTKSDSAQIFGDFVADQLRQLDDAKSKQLQRIIQREILRFTTPLDEVIAESPESCQSVIILTPPELNDNE